MKKYPSFFQQVWRACAAIPAGETRTYQWIAERIKKPRAYRAVGTALAKNPFAPYIPCHRIIRSNGSTGGYSGKGGTRKKMAMIKEEKKRESRG